MSSGNLNDVRQYFDLTAAAFAPLWRALTTKDKEDLKSGVGTFVNGVATGTLNY